MFKNLKSGKPPRYLDVPNIYRTPGQISVIPGHPF